MADPRASVRVVWSGHVLTRRVQAHLERNMLDAVEHLRLKVVKNLSIPVERNEEGQVTVRSVPGEYPRAETGRLRTSLVTDIGYESAGVLEGIVGTDLEYGVVLEVSQPLRRSFLKRALFEETKTITRILTRPMRA